MLSRLYSLIKMMLSVLGIVFLINRFKDLFNNNDYEYEVDSLFGNESQSIKQKPKQKRAVNSQDLYYSSLD